MPCTLVDEIILLALQSEFGGLGGGGSLFGTWLAVPTVQSMGIILAIAAMELFPALSFTMVSLGLSFQSKA